jgi:hypothetical protein
MFHAVQDLQGLFCKIGKMNTSVTSVHKIRSSILKMKYSAVMPHIQWVPGVLLLGVKHLGREAYHSPPSSAKVKNLWSYTSTPTICIHGMVFS